MIYLKKNLLITGVIALLVGGAVGFLAGMQYQKSQNQNRLAQFTNGNFGGRMGIGNFRPGGNGNIQAVRGQIISKDDKSITIKLQDGSTKVIILGSSTNIAKTTEGSANDLTEGSEVSVFGTNNPDGSVTAQNIQLGGGFLRPRPSASPSSANQGY